MIAIIALNVGLAILVVVAILALLGWGIAADRRFAASTSLRRRPASRPRAARARRRALGFELSDLSS